VNTNTLVDPGLTKETVTVFCALMQRDANTGAHSDRTHALSIELGRAAALPSSALGALGLAAQLHDVGKISIPDAILFKPGRLDLDEFEIMTTHSQLGHDILAVIPDAEIAAVAQIVLCHHEHFSGSGYPGGLKGEAIPVLSRIIAIADSYDAMSEDRPYRGAKAHEDIMRILFEENSDKYDPYLVAKFAVLIESSQYRSTGLPPT
jgi:HD-GYP domain-containing protein (c-di-GMP phosphodiesterase class II)